MRGQKTCLPTNTGGGGCRPDFPHPKRRTPMATADNLKEAFAGESQANRKYLAFAKKAEAEGHPQIAKLFRAAAEAETMHALSHFRVMKGVPPPGIRWSCARTNPANVW